MSPPSFRPALAAIDAFQPARTTLSVREEFGVDRVLKLAGNENTLPTPASVRAAIAEAAAGLGEYPDVSWTRLAERLAARHGVSADAIVIENGLFALMPLIAALFLDPGDESIIPNPTFGWYEIVTRTAGGRPVPVPLDDRFRIDLGRVLEAVTARTRLVWLCNPNNPTGTIFGAAELDAFLAALPETVVVVLDEAYCDFVEAADYPRSVPLLDRHANLVILRTFSKLYGLAGLRVGYSLSSPAIARELNKVRAPVSVNTLAQAAALAALEDTGFLAETLRRNRDGKAHWAGALDRLGLPHVPTEANFLLFDTGSDGTAIVRDYLSRGILLRGGAGFGLPSFIRVTIGGAEENRAVTDLLPEFLAARRGAAF